MSSFEKYIALPEVQLKTLEAGNCDKLDKDTVKRILQVALLLAKIDGYNSNYNIRGKNGDFLKNTNVIDLIEKIESEDTQIPGEEDFILLLSQANVPAELIINERIKNRLAKYNNNLTPLPTFSKAFDTTLVDEKVRKPLVAKPKAGKKTNVEREVKYHDFFVPGISEKTVRRKKKQPLKKIIKWKKP